MLEAIKEKAKTATDSIANYVNGLGTPSDPATRAQPDLQHGERLDVDDLDILYLQNDLARRIVDEIVEDAVRGGWDVRRKSNNEPVEEPDHLDIAPKVERAGKLGRLYGGAHVFMVHTDAKWSTPVEQEPPDNLVVLDRYEAPVRNETRDLSDTNFGEPETYSLTPQGSGSSNEAHRSRLLTFGGNPLPERLESINGYYDDSVLQAVWEPLRNFNQTESSIANIIQRFETSTIRIAGLSSVLQDGEGRELIQERMQIFQKGLSAINAALLDADADESYEREFANVQGLDTLWDRLAHSVAKAATMPMTQLFGMTPSGLATDDQSGRANWRKQVGAYRENQLRPALEHYYSILAGEPVEIVFPPLDETAPKEEAEIAKLKAEARSAYVDRGAMRVPELRQLLEDDGLIKQAEPQNDAMVVDPYDGPDDPSIPEHVSAADRPKWVEVWNETFDRTGKEGAAFKAANSAVSS